MLVPRRHPLRPAHTGQSGASPVFAEVDQADRVRVDSTPLELRHSKVKVVSKSSRSTCDPVDSEDCDGGRHHGTDGAWNSDGVGLGVAMVLGTPTGTAKVFCPRPWQDMPIGVPGRIGQAMSGVTKA